MAESKKAPSPASTGEVALYTGFLGSFMALLAGASFLFGMSPLAVTFALFIVTAVAIVAVASRVMG